MIPADTPAPPDTLTEAAIRDLVHGFYDVVRADDLIGPIFDSHIAADAWPAHLGKMCDFWSSVLLRTGRYDGRPLSPHLSLGELGEPHFRRWLALFRPVAARTLPAAEARRAIAQAERMAQSFRLAIAFQRGENTAFLPPLAG